MNRIIVYMRSRTIVLAMVLAIVMLSNAVDGMPGYGKAAPALNGPWEILVQTDLEKQGLSFPIKVDDEDKPQKLTSVLPVLGTPIEIKLAQYLPDLDWDTAAVKDPNGGVVIELTVKGQDLEQDIWLSSSDPAKQSVSSRIGGIELKTLNNGKGVEKLLREMVDTNAVGIITAWADDGDSPVEYVANRLETITVPISKYSVKVLDFFPHYSVDTQTKEVVNRSDKPVNPAIKISVSDGENTSEQWLWSKFPSYPHTENKLPIRIQFTYFDPNMAEGRYTLVAAREAEPWLFFVRDGKIQLEKALIGQPYPFTNKDYFFTIGKVSDGSIIKTDWKNGSEKLSKPAIVAVVKQDDSEQEVVLELNKPFHHKTASGTMILIYRPTVNGLQTSH